MLRAKAKRRHHGIEFKDLSGGSSRIGSGSCAELQEKLRNCSCSPCNDLGIPTRPSLLSVKATVVCKHTPRTAAKLDQAARVT